MEINVAYALKDKYIYMTFVSISSLLKNNKKSSFNLYILYNKATDKHTLDQFNIFKRFKNLNSINFIKVDESKYDSIPDDNNTIYALELINLNNIDKILFINNVTLINGSIAEVYNTNIEEYKCASTEFDCWWDIRKVCTKDFYFAHYFILFNLKKLRENNIYEKFLSRTYLENYPKTEKLFGLGVMNILIKKCLKLPLKYGYAERWFLNIDNLPCSDEYKKEYNKYLKHKLKPLVIMFSLRMPYKKECKHSYLKLWWKYAKKTPIYDTIKHCKPKTPFENFKEFLSEKVLERYKLKLKYYKYRILANFAFKEKRENYKKKKEDIKVLIAK